MIAKTMMSGLLAGLALSLGIAGTVAASPLHGRENVSVRRMLPRLVGQRVHVLLVDKQFFDGEVVDQDENSITLKINGKHYEIPLGQIEHIEAAGF